jgi:hypothetical protein
MLEGLIAQLVGTAVASKRRAIRVTLTKVALILVGALFVLAAFTFALMVIYHALTPRYLSQVEAAGVIAIVLLVIGGILVAIAIWANRRPRATVNVNKPDTQSAELAAIEALGMLNKALTDIGKGRGGTSPYLGVLGIAALVGFIAGRKR